MWSGPKTQAKAKLYITDVRSKWLLAIEKNAKLMRLISPRLAVTPDPSLYIHSSSPHGCPAHETCASHICEHLYFFLF